MIIQSDIRTYSRFLASLPAAEFALLLPHLKEIALQAGDVLHDQGERIQYVYFPFGGMISLLAVMHDGKAVETAVVGREGAVGVLARTGPWHAVARAVVQVSGSGARISAAQLQRIIRESDVLRETIIQYKEGLLAQTHQSAACNALHGAQARLARWLLQTGDVIGSDTIPLTQEFLSEMLGVRRTTVTTIARALQTIGAIRYSRGRIEIAEREKLMHIACECYAVLRAHLALDSPTPRR